MTDRPSADLPRVLAGSPTDDELAAIVAVFSEIQAERAAADALLPPPALDAQWARERRTLRGLGPQPTHWHDLR